MELANFVIGANGECCGFPQHNENYEYIKMPELRIECGQGNKAFIYLRVTPFMLPLDHGSSKLRLRKIIIEMMGTYNYGQELRSD